MSRNKLSRTDLLVGGVAALVVLGWILHWSRRDDFDPFGSWFSTLSFWGSLVVAVYVLGQPLGFIRLPGDWGRRLIPILSLVPLSGFLVDMITPVDKLLREVGTIALAYLSATTYWRKQFLDLASRQPTKGPKAREE